MLPPSDPTGEPPRSLRVFACGATGSGKTSLLRRYWADVAPRLLLCDATGEWGQPEAETVHGVLEAIRGRVRMGAARWRIVAALPPEHLEALAHKLVPPGAARRGLATALGGVAIMLDEVDLVAPHGASQDILGLWRRGRHAGLSIYAATQRPATCARDVTAQSDVIVALATHEARDVAYLRRVLGDAAMNLHARATARDPHGGVYVETRTGRVALVGSEKRP